jgi:predicted chitinase
MALQSSPVTTTDMGPDMGTLAMQDAQEQSAIRSVTGITESLGRTALPTGTDAPSINPVVGGGREPTKDEIKSIQQRLKKSRYYKGAVDGILGPDTTEALRSFQVGVNLRADKVRDETRDSFRGTIGDVGYYDSSQNINLNAEGVLDADTARYFDVDLTDSIKDVTLPSTDSVSDMYPTQGLMSPPVQDTVSGVDTDTPEAPVEDDTVATYSETTDVEGLEGPEAISSAVVQSLKKQTDTVSRGDKGNTVLNAQLRLAELGYEIGRGGTSGLSKNKQGKWVSLDNSQLRGVDSDFGPSTQSAVKDFQEDAGLPITGEIDAATATALATKEPVVFRVPENLTKNFSTAQTSNFNAAKDAAEKEGLKGAELASFMAQVAHESDSFRTAKEYASGSAYEGRSDLGNTQAGDGVRYKGRGYIQLTGRSNYEKAGKALGLDLLNNPSLAEEPKNAAAVSLWFWKTKVKPQVPDFMDTERVTKVVNGGFNGLKDRKKYFEKFTKKWSDDK